MSENNPDNTQGLNLETLTRDVDFQSMYEEDVDRKQVNFWINEAYQERFLAIQKRTRYKFGKELCKLIEKCVDMAEAADPYRQDRTA